MFRRQIFTILLILLKRWNCEMTIALQNELINGDLAEPHLAPNIQYQSLPSLPGWSCTSICEIVSCILSQKSSVSYNRIFANCEGQVIDLDSNGIHEKFQQLVSLKAIQFELSFNYYYPAIASNRKVLNVYFNNQVIFHHLPQAVTSFQKFSFTKRVLARQGINNITFKMTGLVDMVGFKVGKISLKKYYKKQFEQTVNSFMMNSEILAFASFAGSRILFGELINFFISFDRLQLYSFHDRIYSYYYQILLNNVQTIKSTQGGLFKSFANYFFPSKIDEIEEKIESTNYKGSYINPNVLGKSDKGYELYTNSEDFLLYSLPAIFATALLGQIFFFFFRKWPVSRLFRKLSFGGIVLLMMAEGNIESITFYFLGEARSLFFFRIEQKLKNVSIIFAFSVFLFCATSIFLWLKASYGKLVSYFSEQYRVNALSLVALSIDRGVVCLAFGAIHQLLLSLPNQQLLSLGVLELLSIAFRCLWLTKGVFKQQKMLECIDIAENLVRVTFQLSCFLYQTRSSAFINNYLNDKIHFLIFNIFLFIWGLKLVFALLFFSRELFHLFAVIVKSKIPRTKIKVKQTRIKKEQKKKEFQNWQKQL